MEISAQQAFDLYEKSYKLNDTRKKEVMSAVCGSAEDGLLKVEVIITHWNESDLVQWLEPLGYQLEFRTDSQYAYRLMCIRWQGDMGD